jgi:hypothetical protein
LSEKIGYSYEEIVALRKKQKEAKNEVEKLEIEKEIQQMFDINAIAIVLTH